MSGHVYDLCLAPEALKIAARSAVACWCPDDADLTLTRTGEWFTVQSSAGRCSLQLKSGQGAESRTEEITLTRSALHAAARWATAGENMADVCLLVDDRMLLVYQGDDRAGFDTGGEPASDEYLAVAPLDR
jgi:hypothetical protein